MDNMWHVSFLVLDDMGGNGNKGLNEIISLFPERHFPPMKRSTISNANTHICPNKMMSSNQKKKIHELRRRNDIY